VRLDLVCKQGRVRTVPMATLVRVAVDAWTSAVGVADGRVFPAAHRGGQVQGAALLFGTACHAWRFRSGAGFVASLHPAQT
jgi:hypothetical protein